MKKYKFYGIAIFLGFLLSLSPLLTGMYTLVLPKLQDYFSTDLFHIQLTISLSVVGLALGQLLWGIISDFYSRKIILILSLLCFTLFSILSTFNVSISYFLLMRFFQGLFAAGAIMSSRSLGYLYFGKKELLKGMAIVTFIYSLSKIIYPILGGKILITFNWKYIFYFISLLSFILMVLFSCIKVPKRKRMERKKTVISIEFKQLLSNKIFLMPLILFTFVQILQFSYVSSATFIFQKIYMLNPYQFSILFSLSAGFFALGNFISSKFSIKNLIKITPWGIFLSAVFLYISTIFLNKIYFFILFLLIFRFFMGQAYTLYMSLAMSACNNNNAGTASAFLGVIAYLFAATISLLTGIGDIQITTVSIFCIVSILILCISQKFLKDVE